MKQSFLYALTASLITALFLFADSASAQPGQNVTVVSTADLNLADAEARRTLDARLVHAAREVCGLVSDSDPRGKNDARKCRAETLANARSQRDRLIASRDNGPVIAVTAER